MLTITHNKNSVLLRKAIDLLLYTVVYIIYLPSWKNASSTRFNIIFSFKKYDDMRLLCEDGVCFRSAYPA